MKSIVLLVAFLMLLSSNSFGIEGKDPKSPLSEPSALSVSVAQYGGTCGTHCGDVFYVGSYEECCYGWFQCSDGSYSVGAFWYGPPQPRVCEG